jgi:hypothetical protein
MPDGRWLLVGGLDVNGAPVGAAVILDQRTNQASPLSSQLAQARAGHSATLLPDGKVLILGGTLASGAVAEAAERFDPASGSFETLPPLGLIARTRHTATLLSCPANQQMRDCMS